jgi:hypothetical protein
MFPSTRAKERVALTWRDIMTKAALFAAALLISLPAASHAQVATQGSTTMVQSGAGETATAPKLKKVQKTKKSKATKVRRTTTGTSETPGVRTGTSTTTGVTTGGSTTGVTTGTSGTVRSGTGGTVGR